ncbi:MAG TPA: PHP domain-containing protein, partial [bacterium (Candidatus Stahlbacteria)]|nr:PHP domain-containing protein [Candidatus Stahlbacteria bacterium]
MRRGRVATDFIPLHCHSSHSVGFFLIRDLVKKVKGLGYPGLALVDTDLFGMVEFFKICQNQGLKPILGAELNGLLIIVKDRKGYENLSSIITEYHRTGTITPKEGLIYLSQSEHRLESLSKKTPLHDLFQIIPPYRRPGRFPPIAVPEINCQDQEVFPVFLKIKGLKGEPGPVPARDQILNSYHPEAVRNTVRIFNSVNFTLEPKRSFPRFSGDLLSLLRGKSKNRREQLRLEYELKLIRGYGCESLFLIVYQIFSFARNQGIMVQVRGSGVASLILHKLGLSVVNPLDLGLPFERFLNPKRDDPPDIDLDVDYRYRDLLIQRLIRIVGPDHAARPAVINRFHLPGAFRAVALVLGIPSDELKRS